MALVVDDEPAVLFALAAGVSGMGVVVGLARLGVRNLLTFPDNQLYWEHGTALSGADFREYVDGVREGK